MYSSPGIHSPPCFELIILYTKDLLSSSSSTLASVLCDESVFVNILVCLVVYAKNKLVCLN